MTTAYHKRWMTRNIELDSVESGRPFETMKPVYQYPLRANNKAASLLGFRGERGAHRSVALRGRLREAGSNLNVHQHAALFERTQRCVQTAWFLGRRRPLVRIRLGSRRRAS